jgi:hypothetical protein
MKTANLTLGAGLILLAGSLLVPGITSAQALKTPIEGSSANCSNLGEPEREWVDEDGITHVRGQRGRCDWSGDLQGRFPSGGERFVANWDWDLADGPYFEHGTDSFSGRLFGKVVEATGHYTFECIGPFQMATCIVEAVWHLEDGRLVKFTMNWVEGDGDPTFPYTGIVLDPPGLGPVKRNRPRTKK